MDNQYYKFKNDIGGSISRYVDQLDQDGQIDRDDNTDPIVLGYEKISGSNLARVKISRDGVEQSIVMNPKSRKMEPVKQTFDGSDNWKRTDQAPRQIAPQAAAPVVNPGAERERRQPQQQAPAATATSQAGASPQRIIQRPKPFGHQATYEAIIDKMLR